MLPQDRRPRTLAFVRAIQDRAKVLAGIEIPNEEILSRVRAFQYGQAQQMMTDQFKQADEDALFEMSQELEKIIAEQNVEPKHIRPEGKGRR